MAQTETCTCGRLLPGAWEYAQCGCGRRWHRTEEGIEEFTVLRLAQPALISGRERSQIRAKAIRDATRDLRDLYRVEYDGMVATIQGNLLEEAEAEAKKRLIVSSEGLPEMGAPR